MPRTWLINDSFCNFLSRLPAQDQLEKATYVPLTSRIACFQLAWSYLKPTVSNQGTPGALQFLPPESSSTPLPAFRFLQNASDHLVSPLL